MKMVRQDRGERCLLVLKGRLDAKSAPGLKKAITGTVSREFVVDFSDVEFMDSSGLGALVTSTRRLREEKGDLKISGLKDAVRRVFEMTRAHLLFDIYDDTEAALTSF